MTQRFPFIALAAIAGLAPAFGQFGGRPGDAVFYLLTNKGAGDFITVADGTANTATQLQRFEFVDPEARQFVLFGPPFPDVFKRKIMHEEPDDLFQLVLQEEGPPGPNRYFLKTYKIFVIDGWIRVTGANVDFGAGVFATLKEGVDFQRDKAIDKVKSLYWAALNAFPATQGIPEGVPGPAVPPGRRGLEIIVDTAQVPAFIPWNAIAKSTGNSRWTDGIDHKIIEVDRAEGTTQQFIRLRPGRTTPTFRISGATHVWGLHGAANLLVNGRPAQRVGESQYAFLPPGTTLRIANPRGATPLPR